MVAGHRGNIGETTATTGAENEANAHGNTSTRSASQNRKCPPKLEADDDQIVKQRPGFVEGPTS